MTIFQLGNDKVRCSASLIGLPSIPASQVSASSTIRTRAVCRRKFLGDRASAILREPPAKRSLRGVLRSPSSAPAASAPRKVGIAAKIGSISETM
jgi:hypothetical protein